MWLPARPETVARSPTPSSAPTACIAGDGGTDAHVLAREPALDAPSPGAQLHTTDTGRTDSDGHWPAETSSPDLRRGHDFQRPARPHGCAARDAQDLLFHHARGRRPHVHLARADDGSQRDDAIPRTVHCDATSGTWLRRWTTL